MELKHVQNFGREISSEGGPLGRPIKMNLRKSG
jgi:hypothetical protein